MNEKSVRITDPGKSPTPAQIKKWLGEEAYRYWIRMNEEPRSRAARYLIVRSYYFHIRSLTPQQAARNAFAIRFNGSIRTIQMYSLQNGYLEGRSMD